MMRTLHHFALFLLGLVVACTSPPSSRDPRANAREITGLPEGVVFYLNDHHGSPVATLDRQGHLIEARSYHAYGAEREPASAYEPWAFAGNELDATLLGDFHARPYDARLGRFLAVDPEPLFNPNAQLNPVAFQAYSYAAGDPVNLEDPTGRSVWTKVFKFGVRLAKTGDAAQSLYGMFDDAVTLFDASASITDRVVAGVSLASELAPVSIGDLKDAGKALGSLADVQKKGRTAVEGAEIAARPSRFRKGTVQDVWDNATDAPGGGKVCPTCSREVSVRPGAGTKQSPRDWDVDHQPPWSARDQTGKTRKEVLDDYNSGVRLECPTCNRSRGARPADD